ncbi:MAG: alkaline phosphatase [Spirochaetales bacterium]|nr:alkaline phosphatase [Spirochaetales bacterium]
MGLANFSNNVIFCFLVFLSCFLRGNYCYGEEKSPDCIIIMISDGCGYETLKAADLFDGKKQVYEEWEHQWAVSTYPYGGSYSSDLAWTDSSYLDSGYTDSAAAATALSTGSKTSLGTIGRDSLHQSDYTHLMEKAKAQGFATGVVTSVEWSHATPAGFTAHNNSRQNYREIAREILEGDTDVVMGCGHPEFNNEGKARSPLGLLGHYRYVGGKKTWDRLNSAYDGYYNNWSLIETLSDFNTLAEGSGPYPEKVLAIPQVYETLQYRRRGEASGGLNQSVPSLATMARGALNVLSSRDSRFVLMIEGGAVDWAAHDNKGDRLIEEERAFNDAVEEVVSWIEERSGWDNSLLIVTADHETGHVGGIGPEGEPGVIFNSKNHTNQLVPLFARGVGAEGFNDYVVGRDKVRGAYIDNTAVGQYLSSFLSGE